MSEPAISFSSPYTDASGAVHATYYYAPAAGGRELRGEAIYDARLARTVLDETAEAHPRDVVVALKRAMHGFAEDWLKERPEEPPMDADKRE